MKQGKPEQLSYLASDATNPKPVHNHLYFAEVRAFVSPCGQK